MVVSSFAKLVTPGSDSLVTVWAASVAPPIARARATTSAYRFSMMGAMVGQLVMRRHFVSAMAIALLLAAACARPAEKPATATVATPRFPMTGPLIAATVSMKAGWEFPRNPLTDKTLDNSRLSEEIRRGFRLFTNTPTEAPKLAPGGMACTNCHMNAGQREKSMPLVNIAGMFPEYNRRAARLFSLGDRITDCFLRSENATGAQLASDELPTPTSSEVLAVSAYLTWLSRGAEMGKSPS